MANKWNPNKKLVQDVQAGTPNAQPQQAPSTEVAPPAPTVVPSPILKDATAGVNAAKPVGNPLTSGNPGTSAAEAPTPNPMPTAEELANQDFIGQKGVVEQSMKDQAATDKRLGLDTGRPTTIQETVDQFKAKQAAQKSATLAELDRQKALDASAAKKFDEQAAGSLGATAATFAQGREGAMAGSAPAFKNEFSAAINQSITDNRIRLESAQAQRDQIMTQLDDAQKSGNKELADSLSGQLAAAQNQINVNKTNVLNALSQANQDTINMQAANRQNLTTFTGMVDQGVTMTPTGISSMAKTLNIPFDVANSYYESADQIRTDKSLSVDEKKAKLDDLTYNFNLSHQGYVTEQAKQIKGVTDLVKSGKITQEEGSQMLMGLNIDSSQNPMTQVKLRLDKARADMAELNAKYAYSTPPEGTKAYLEYQKAKLDLQIAEADNAEFTNTVPESTVKDVFYQPGKSDYGHGEGRRECGEAANDITEGTKVGNSYASKMAIVTKKDNPQIGNELVLPLASGGGLVKDNQKEPGHIETIFQTNPLAGTIKTVSWNRDGNGTQTIQTYNIDDLSKKYGDNWGFSDSKLKPQYLDKLQSTEENPAGQGQGYRDFLKQAKENGLPYTDAKKWASDQAQKAMEGAGVDAPDLDSLAKGLANYDVDPKDISSRLPAGASESERAKVMKMAMDINPTYSAGNFAAKKSVIDSWNGAPTPNTYAYTNNAANTALKHLGTLKNAFDEMKNSGVKDANGVLNYVRDHAGDPNIAAFQSILEPMAGEIAKATTGGNPTEGEIKSYRDIFDMNKTPDQMLATIKSQVELMSGRIKTNVNKYKKDIGVLPKDAVLDQESQDVLKKLGLTPSEYDPTLKATPEQQAAQQAQVKGLLDFGASLITDHQASTGKYIVPEDHPINNFQF